MIKGANRKHFWFTIYCLFFVLIFISHTPQANAASPMDKLSDIQNTIKSKIQEVREARRKETSLTSKIKNINNLNLLNLRG